MKKLLCFGDSNTYGYRYYDRGRFDENTRWTGLLSKMLEAYDIQVIEQGLNSRTTVFDCKEKPDKNGSKALPDILGENYPLDYAIVMLGTNDCKTEFNATVNEITDGLDVIISQIRLFDSRTKIILVCPVYISETVLSHNFSTSFDEKSISKSIELEEKIKKLAADNDCIFLSAARIADTSETDGIHLDEEGHKALAQAFFECVKREFL